MARDHARIQVSIWDDPAWLALTSVQQLVYLALTSSNDLSYCGVVPYVPARYEDISADMTEQTFAEAVAGLEAARFVVVDRRTAELLVRSYVRHDGLLHQPNVTKAMTRALGKVHSPVLAGAVRLELARMFQENPDARGWAGFRELDPEGFAQVSSNPSPNPSGNPSPKGSPNPEATPLPPSPFPLPELQGASHPQRATQLPDSWTPNRDHEVRAMSTSLDVEREATKFRAHAEEKGRTAKSWNAAFTRWLINAAEYAKRDGTRGARATGTNRAMDTLAIAAQLEAQEGATRGAITDGQAAR